MKGFVATALAMCVLVSGVTLTMDSFATTSGGVQKATDEVKSKTPIMQGRFNLVSYETRVEDSQGNLIKVLHRQSVVPSTADFAEINVQMTNGSTYSIRLPADNELPQQVKSLIGAQNVVRILDVNGKSLKSYPEFQDLAGFHFNFNSSYVADSPWSVDEAALISEQQKFLQAHPFLDLSSHWAEQQVNALAAQDIIHGVTPSMFDPEAMVTRAEFVCMLAGVMKGSGRVWGVKSAPLPEDIADAFWSASAFSEVKGYMDYVAPGEFDSIFESKQRLQPNLPMTRAEAITIMSYFIRMGGTPKTFGPVVFSDYPQANDTRIQELVNEGVMTGDGDGKFRPLAQLTRAEMASAILRLSYTL